MDEILGLKTSLYTYEEQLKQIDAAIKTSAELEERNELISLQNDIKQLVCLTKENLDKLEISFKGDDDDEHLVDEYALFMAAIQEDEGDAAAGSSTKRESPNIEEELRALEGMKCRVPFNQEFGEIPSHNAIVSSVLSSSSELTFDNIEVKVLFINPTRESMLTCPYLLESTCRFSSETCKYSHGEIVALSTLQEYVEPNFELLKVGSKVLAKHSSSKLWGRAVVQRIYNEKCGIKFDSSKQVVDVPFVDILPLSSDEEETTSDNSESEVESAEDVVQSMALETSTTTNCEAMGDWEKYTKGFGSKIMQKMGYISGTGLGKQSDGRIEPIPAVILPCGKSLDYCMNLREKAGNVANFFYAEKNLARLQKRQEIKNRKKYEREKRKKNVFSFLNDSLLAANSDGRNTMIPSASSSVVHRQEIRKESLRNLGVAGLQIDKDMKRLTKDLAKIRECLSRHTNPASPIHKQLKAKLIMKQSELRALNVKANNIASEQTLRLDKKKLSVF